MSKADKIFEELGYRKVDTELNFILAQFKTGQNIIQFFENKKIAIYEIYEHETVYISMDLLKAINKKVQELGWNKDRTEYFKKYYKEVLKPKRKKQPNT